MAPAADRLAAMSEGQRQELESLLLDFAVAWSPEALAGRVETLPSKDQDYRQFALVELVKIDVQRQWQAGNQPLIENYLERFPELGTTESVASQLPLAEYQARRLSGVSGELHDFARRFPQQIERLEQLLQQSTAATSSHVSRAAHTNTSRVGEKVETQAEPTAKSWSLPQEFGRYRILKALGEGGMGSVLLAHDTELDRQVAIKTPKFDGGEDPQLIERFYREARAAARLQNRHICPVYDVGEIDGVRYISMAYIEGRPLSAYTRSARNQPERSVVLVVRRLSLALQEAHAQGVVHRDLKPANIMIDGKREPVIMDFGVARQMDQPEDPRLTKSGMIVGTPAYMSPEQVSSQTGDVGPSSDIYSLGVILYELLTGHVPFDGSMAAVLGQVLTQPPPRPSEFRADIDPRLEQICLKMMAKRIEDRYQSMGEVADALGQWLQRPAGDELKELEDDVFASGVSLTQGEDQLPQNIFATEYADGSFDSVNQSTGSMTSAPVPAVRAWRRSRVMWLAAAFLGLILLGLLIVLRTPQGVLKIDVRDPNLIILIDGNEYTVEQLTEPQTLDVGSHRLGVQVGDTVVPIGRKMPLKTVAYDGQYKLAVTLDGTSLTSESFTIVRGDERVLSITLESVPEPNAVASGMDLPQQASAAQKTEVAAPVPPAAIAPFCEVQAKQHQQAWADYLNVPIEREIELSESVTLTMVLIPPGEFMMGSTAEEQARFLEQAKADGDQWPVKNISSEGPQHLVRITQPFALSRHEITRGQFRQFVKATGYKTDAERDGKGGHALGRDDWPQDPRFIWNAELGYPQTDDSPVVNVSWNDALAFCRWLTNTHQSEYCLPTEAQWEYACRAGTKSLWHCGDRHAELAAYAHFLGGEPHAVGQLSPNAWGLFDMHGNVSEWCADQYGRQFYAQSQPNDPLGPVAGSSRVHRGGNWVGRPWYCRSAFRHHAPMSFRNIINGFRVAQSLVATANRLSGSTPTSAANQARTADVALPDTDVPAGQDPIVTPDLHAETHYTIVPPDLNSLEWKTELDDCQRLMQTEAERSGSSFGLTGRSVLLFRVWGEEPISPASLFGVDEGRNAQPVDLNFSLQPYTGQGSAAIEQGGFVRCRLGYGSSPREEMPTNEIAVRVKFVAVHHYSQEIPLNFRKGQVVPVGDVILRRLPKSRQGKLSVSVTVEDDAPFSGGFVQLGHPDINTVDIPLSSTPDSHGRTEWDSPTVGAGRYFLTAGPDKRWTMPRTNVTVVGGKTTQVDLTVYKQRKLTFTWWFRAGKATKWRTGVHRMLTGDSWKPEATWGRTSYPGSIQPWNGTECRWNAVNFRAGAVDDFSSPDAVEFPPRDSRGQGLPMSVGSVIALYREQDRKQQNLQVIIRLEQVAVVGSH